jgi:murein L,D-transpeptidase YafK
MKMIGGIVSFLSIFFVFFYAISYQKLASPKDITPSKNASLSLGAINYIKIFKHQRTLQVYRDKHLVKSYKIALGFCPIGHKVQEGDGKTPQGIYTITFKNTKSRYHRSLKISYPSKKDSDHAKKKGVSPGGDIMIHGLGKWFAHLGKKHTLHDWTLGCVAITNEEIDELFNATKVGTTVEIVP